MKRFSKKTQRKERKDRLLTDFISHNHLESMQNITLVKIKKKKNKSNKVRHMLNNKKKKKKNKSSNKKKVKNISHLK